MARGQVVDGLADRIVSAANNCNMTLLELAKKTGVGQTRIYNFANGEENPNAWHIRAMCEAMDVSADWLLFGKER